MLPLGTFSLPKQLESVKQKSSRDPENLINCVYNHPEVLYLISRRLDEKHVLHAVFSQVLRPANWE